MLRVLVVDESVERASEICAGLAAAGHQVAATLPSALELVQRVEAIRPDVILIQTDSPSRDTLEHLAELNRSFPRPVILLSRDAGGESIRAAMKVGVSAYVADGLAPGRIEPLIAVAMARFEEYQALRKERDEASRKLAERVTVERAKGLLMKARALDEEAAYHLLRKSAMERGRRIGEVAQEVIDAARLLL